MKEWTRRAFLGAAAAGTAGLMGCPRKKSERVAVYTALDEMYARPILEEWSKTSGVEAALVFDTEASKTTGMVTRLIAERDRPRADVFWNNEVAQSIVLRDKGVIEAYRSPMAAAIPDQYKDPDGYWTGFAARARVVVYNKNLVPDPPRSIMDLAKPEWKGKAAIGNPLFGTTATHAAALFATWGEAEARGFFMAVKGNQVAVLPGNAPVMDLVGRGEYAWGLTDTDDANSGVLDGLPLGWYPPDQEDAGLGTLVIPNTPLLVRGGPNPDAGKKLIDYLLGPAVEEKLARGRSLQIPLNPAVPAPEGVPKISELKSMDVSWDEIGAHMESAARFIQEEFLS